MGFQPCICECQQTKRCPRCAQLSAHRIENVRRCCCAWATSIRTVSIRARAMVALHVDMFHCIVKFVRRRSHSPANCVRVDSCARFDLTTKHPASAACARLHLRPRSTAPTGNIVASQGVRPAGLTSKGMRPGSYRLSVPRVCGLAALATHTAHDSSQGYVNAATRWH